MREKEEMLVSTIFSLFPHFFFSKLVIEKPHYLNLIQFVAVQKRYICASLRLCCSGKKLKQTFMYRFFLTGFECLKRMRIRLFFSILLYILVRKTMYLKTMKKKSSIGN